jgi:hypothetical protein
VEECVRRAKVKAVYTDGIGKSGDYSPIAI